MREPDLIENFINALCAQHPGARVELNGGSAIARDAALLEESFAAPNGSALLRIWDNRKCVVASRRLAHRPGFEAACAHSTAAGWPVFVRPSGGTAVVHRPGIVNISLAYSENQSRPGMAAAYDRLAVVICGALLSMGVDADMGAVPSSFCDGNHNIRWRGRKLAGTAGVMKRRSDITGRLVHASLCVSGDLGADIAAIRRVEQLCGLGADYNVRAHVTLAEACRAALAA